MGEDIAESLHINFAHGVTQISHNKTFRVCIVNGSNKPVTLQAHRRLRFYEPIPFKGLLVYWVTLAPGQCHAVWPIISDGKTLVNGGGSWMASQECNSAILESKVLICGEGSIQAVLQTLFHLVKVIDPSWELTKEGFNQLNIGPSLNEEEKWPLGDLMQCCQ